MSSSLVRVTEPPNQIPESVSSIEHNSGMCVGQTITGYNWFLNFTSSPVLTVKYTEINNTKNISLCRSLVVISYKKCPIQTVNNINKTNFRPVPKVSMKDVKQ